MEEKDINLAGRISHFFAVNRSLSILLLLVSLVFGLVAFFLTPKQYNPEIERPAFLVTIQYQGASVDESIDRVVYELVEKVQTVKGVDDIYTEVRDGSVIKTTVIFEVGYDSVLAKIDLATQLKSHSYLARGNIQFPQIAEINPETIPVLQVVFGSDELTVSELRKQVVSVAHNLQSTVGVSELSIYGGYPPTVTIEIDPVLLAEADLLVDDVYSAITQSQTRSVMTGVGDERYVIESTFEFGVSSPEELGNLLIGERVRLRDVAEVYEGVTRGRSYVLYQDKEKAGEVVMLSVAKIEGTSAPVVASDFISELDNLLKEPDYKNLSYKIVGNDGVTASNEIYGLTKNLVTSVLIVSVVLFLFLSWQASVVVLVAIPVTLLVVFGLGLLFDQTINRVTLFALILSLGLLVDSAIVAVENIYSRLKQSAREGWSRGREVIIAGAIDEIGVGLLLSTITSVIVFLPMNYITGMMGPYMGPIAFFVPMALMVSFLVAIVVTPSIAQYVLRVKKVSAEKVGLFDLLMERVTSFYTRTLQGILASRSKQRMLLLSALGLFLISVLLPIFGLVHFQMLPKANLNQFYVYLDLPVDTAIDETKRVSEAVTTVMLANENVTSVQAFVATPPIVDFNGLFKGVGGRDETYQATFRVNLLNTKDRSLSSTEIVSNVRADIDKEMPALSGAVRLLEEPPGPPVRATLVAKVQTSGGGGLVASDLKKFFSTVEGVVDVYQSDKEKVGRVHYSFDQTSAEAQGVAIASVLSTMRLLDKGMEVEWLNQSSSEYAKVQIGLPANYLATPQVTNSLTVPSVSGQKVPLSSVLKTDYELRQNTAYLEKASEVSYVTAEVEGRSIVYVVIEIIKGLINGDLSGYEVLDWNLWSMTLSSGGEEVSLVWGGEWEMTLENFRDLGIAMGVALLMVYALLVAQYKTFSTPAYILVTVPLGLVGILWGFLLLDKVFNVYLTATALIGFIALIGIVVNNAIIYLEYVEQAMKEGNSFQASLLEAGQARLRPIFLTSLTTVLGSLTIANDPVWSGLAWSIVFGLSLSTILTLVVYPTLLLYFRSNK